MTLEQEKAFDEWFDGQYGLTTTRRDWFFDEIENPNFNRLEEWLHTAFIQGWEAGRNSK